MPYKDPEIRKQKAREYSRQSYLKNKAKKNARSKAWAEDNAERMKELQAEWYQNNKDKVREQTAKWAAENPVRHREIQRKSREKTGCAKKWKQNNRAKVAAYAAKRRAAERNATPEWLTEDDHWAIQQVYLHREEQSQITGIKHEVDHIVPLINDNVCGLHVWWNLQVITETENRIKGNSF